MRRVLRCVVALALVTGASGCARLDEARNGKRPTRAAFLATAEAACTKATTAMKEAGLDTLGERPPTLRLGPYRTALLARRGGYLDFRDDRAPPGDGPRIRSFVDIAVAGIDQLTELTRAQDRRDPRGEDLARTRVGDAFTRARAAGQALGFAACLP